jgi:hypothetical protein
MESGVRLYTDWSAPRVQRLGPYGHDWAVRLPITRTAVQCAYEPSLTFSLDPDAAADASEWR